MGRLKKAGIRIGLLTCFGFILLQVSQAQSLSDYLKLRAKYHIAAAAGEPALETLIGLKVIEVKATVTGGAQVNGSWVILVQQLNGGSLPVQTDNPPTWLLGNETRARLLVRAYRADAQSDLKVRLLGAASEDSMEAIDSRAEAIQKAKAEKLLALEGRSHRATASLTSRKGGAERKFILPATDATNAYAAFILKENPKLGANRAIEIAQEIIGFSIQYGVDARLIMAMVMVESDFDPNSTSNKGAMGLGQLMPCNTKDLGISDPYNTAQNLYGTVKMVRDSLVHYKRQTGLDYESLVLALAGYNAGDGAVKKYGGVPPYKETQAYVKRVIELYRQFCR